MKHLLRNWVLAALTVMARRQLKRIQPIVIAVTGSAGKTSTKECIAAVLERKFNVLKSSGNMNTEFGAALTILRQPKAYTAQEWAKVLWDSVKTCLKKPVLFDRFVMETGVDKPGDMNAIVQVVRPDMAVFLNVKEVHLGEGQFANRQAIFEEKARLCYAVPKEGWVVLNQDDAFVKQLMGKLPANTITIGTEESCDLRAKHIKSSTDGLKFTLCYEDKELPVILPCVMGEAHVSMALAAIAVGFVHGMSWRAIELALQDFHLPSGRMNRIEGKNGSTIIDSSYNASPETMEAGLNVLSEMGGRRIAALGTMNSLGSLSESAHLKIGKLAAKHADMLLAVGEQAALIAEGAARAGMSTSSTHVFRTSKEAGEFLSGILERGDTVLAKGSQDKVRMEHLVKVCMKDPSLAGKLLVRQDSYWLIHP